MAARAFGETRWIRLPFVLLFAGTGWLMFRLTRRLYGARAGAWAVLALNLTPFFTLSPGGWVVPDGPLLFFLLAAVLALGPAVLGGPEETSDPWRRWIAGGLCFGLAGLSKYNALPIALAALGRSVVSDMAPWVYDMGAVIAFVDAGPLPLQGHAALIENAVRNLVENAVRHTPANTGIEVTAGPGATLSVSDDSGLYGLGPADGLSSSSGIGLEIVRRIMRLHEGTLDVHVSPRRRTTMRLAFVEAAEAPPRTFPGVRARS